MLISVMVKLTISLSAVALSLGFSAGCMDHVGYVPPYTPPPSSQPVTVAANADVNVDAQGGTYVDAQGASATTYEDTDPAALTDFHDTLAPHGEWVEDDTYGTVWVPATATVGADFSPYVSGGHWAYGDDEWVWVSDYSWGWAPFHYGRWVFVGGRGWGWIPGRQYAGAWVSWRVGDGGYVGWGPMAPRYYWRGGAVYEVGTPVSTPYVFVPREHVFAPVVATHVVTGEQVGVIASHTQPYVPAAPSVGVSGSVNARVAGPPPSAVGIESSRVVRASASDPSVSRARAFSQPTTAQSLGARPPSPRPVVNPVAPPRTTTAQPPSRVTPMPPSPRPTAPPPASRPHTQPPAPWHTPPAPRSTPPASTPRRTH